MIISMTGFGDARGKIGPYILAVEILSLNSRYLDIFLSLPDFLESHELEIRERIRERIRRGRLRVKVWMEPEKESSTNLRINEDLLRKIIRRVTSIGKEEGIEAQIDVANLLRIPGVIIESHEKVEKEDFLRKFWPLLERAINKLDRSRRKEGKRIEKDIRRRLTRIVELLKRIEKAKKKEIEKERERVKELVKEECFATENVEEKVLSVAIKLDVTEEITRCRSHINQMEDLIKKSSNEGIGRRLEFFCQELHREGTTISNKSLSPEIISLTVELREEVERIREQARNVD